jgi:hypothetical protein
MNNNNEIQIIEHIIGIASDVKESDILSTDIINQLINYSIEKTTGVKIYNKKELLEEITALDVTNLEHVTTIIRKNMIMQIKFDTVFKSQFGFSLIFDDTKPIIVYKNKRVSLKDLEDIRKDIIESKSEHFPPINKLFVETLFTIIEKIINMDPSVVYQCTNWIQPWLVLFENKCYKQDKDMRLKLDKYKYMDNIISGALYKQFEEEKDYDIKEELIENKEDNDTTYRMEVLAYLNDDEVIYFLGKLEEYDKMKSSALYDEIKTISKLLNFTTNTSNKIIKFYFINKLFKYIITIKDFILKNKNFHITVNNKIDEMTDDLYIIQSTGLNLSIELTNTLIEAKEFMHKLKN